MGYIITPETAIKLCHDLKKEDKKVVFTHGAFDLFHAGHSYFLNESKKEGDVLIVGVEPDVNVQRYKSKLRPIVGERDRSQVVSSHEGVDFVFVVDDWKENISEFYMYLYSEFVPNYLTVGKNFGGNIESEEKRLSKLGINLKYKTHDTVPTTTKIITTILNKYQQTP